MATKTARLQKEAQACHVLALQQEALRQAKQRERNRKPGKLAAQMTGFDPQVVKSLPTALRRANVRCALQGHSLLFITVVKCLERPLRRAYLNNWHPPRARDCDRIYDSLLHHVVRHAPLKQHQLERMNQVWGKAANPAVASWLDQTLRDPALATLLPLPPMVFMRRMLDHVFATSPKWILEEALRFAQAVLMGANQESAALIARQMPAGRPDNERAALACIQFVINQWDALTQEQARNLLLFTAIPFHEIDERVKSYFLREIGAPELDFTLQSAPDVLAQLASWRALLYKAQENVRLLPFPACPVPEVLEGSGRFEGLQIRRIQNEAELICEGRTLQHCVASYTEFCSNNAGSIWSMTQNGQKAATIQLNGHRVVVQCKGKGNTRVNELLFDFLIHWVKKRGLAYQGW